MTYHQETAGVRVYPLMMSPGPRGTGPNSGGQSGDTQGLSDLEESNSESIEELIEEGQFYEAEVLSGIENAPDADQGPVRTRQVPEDDVPLEYLERDEPSNDR